MVQNNEKADLPLKATLTTLEFHSGAILTKYWLAGTPLPEIATRAEQLADIAWVDPGARVYLEAVEKKYVALKTTGARKIRTTAFDLNNLATKHPLALARLLDIMSEPYSLPLPFNPPISESTHKALTSLFRKKDQDSLDNLDAVLHKFLNHPPQWHFEMAELAERVAAYLDLKSAVYEFMFGNTTGDPDKASFHHSHGLWSAARCIRGEFRSNIYKNFRPMTKPHKFVLSIVLHRLSAYLKELVGKPGGSVLIAAMIQTAPYTPHYRQYRSTTLEEIQTRLRKPRILPFLL